MAAETRRMTNPAKGFFLWLWKMGLAIPLGMGAILVLLVLMTLASPLYEAPTEVNVGSPDRFEIGEPQIFKEQDFWLVRVSETDFVAIYDRDPASGCGLVWAPNHEHMGRTGWFRDVCSNSTYDLAGSCYGPGCLIGLNLYDLEIVNGEIIVDARNGSRGLLAEDSGDPVNPPQ